MMAVQEQGKPCFLFLCPLILRVLGMKKTETDLMPEAHLCSASQGAAVLWAVTSNGQAWSGWKQNSAPGAAGAFQNARLAAGPIPTAHFSPMPCEQLLDRAASSPYWAPQGPAAQAGCSQPTDTAAAAAQPRGTEEVRGSQLCRRS